MMPSDEEIQPGITQNGQVATEELAGSETIEAKIVEFDGDPRNRITARSWSFSSTTPSTMTISPSGDKLELRLDHQASRAVSLNAFPQKEEPAS
jgi:hypothetical protein